VLQAYEGGGREGFREFRRAQERSGVELPDLPGPRLWFAWGPVMGGGRPMPSSRWRRRWSLRSPRQAAPGAGGWCAAQQAVARRHLAAAGLELDGRSWLEVVVAGRAAQCVGAQPW
jgi:hypothetical protein